MKNSLTTVVCVLAVWICTIGVFADQLFVVGSDKVQPDGVGAITGTSGQDLLFGRTASSSRSRAVFPAATGSTVYHISSDADNQIMWIDGLDANWDRVVVRDTLTETLEGTLGGSRTWARINRIKLVRPAVGKVWFYTTSIPNATYDPDSSTVVYAIFPGQSVGHRAVFSVPRDFVATITPTFSAAMSTTVANTRALGFSGIMGVRARTQTDTTWEVMAQVLVESDGAWMVDPIQVGPRTDVVVTAGVTHASTVFGATLNAEYRHE